MHVGIIMDGNGRWATERGLPRSVGHMRGASRVSDVVRSCPEFEIDTLTLFAFSTENWHRAAHEVEALMKIFRWYLSNKRTELHENGVCVRFIGDPAPLAVDIQEQMRSLEELTKGNSGLFLNIAINYGGRDELTRSVRKIAEQVKAGNIDLDDITEEMVSNNLDTAGLDDPDLIIRTAGELRISNFMIWQSAYTEFAFVDAPWPEYTKEDLATNIASYRSRVRQFGAVGAKAAKAD